MRARRRSTVAQLALRGMKIDEITANLPNMKPPIYNLKTGKPFSRALIGMDLQWNQEQWQAENLKDTGDLKARQFAELQEIKKAAWGGGRLSIVLKSIETEMKLMGTASPIQIDVHVLVKLVDAIEARGEKPSDVFDDMLKYLALEHEPST